MDTNAIRRDVEITYERVKSLAGWTVDKNVVLTIASYYVTSEREFDAESLSRSMDAIKEKSGWFSPLRGNLLPMMAAFIDQPGVVIDDEVVRLFEKQRVLRTFGFRNTIHSYLAALFMTNDSDVYDQEARLAKTLFSEMKKHHFFLTSDDDYTYAVLLGKRGFNPVTQAKSMRMYYDTLRREKFRSGNELQWLSQVMTYVNENYDASLAEKAAENLRQFEKQAKVRPIHYPLIGFLTIFDVSDQEIKRILTLTKALEESEPLKLKKEMALSIGIGYVIHELVGNADDSIVSLATSVELLVQAQEAVMVATIAAVAASTSANSSNS